MSKKSSFKKGYDTRNITSLDRKFKCLICTLILKEPVQMTCGHRLCRFCLPVESDVIQCPECSQITLISKIRFDREISNEMQKLPVICTLCEWSDELKNYQNHLEQCHQQYTCSYCHQVISSLTLLNQHQETTCPQIMVNCKLESYGCREKILRCHLSDHYCSEVHQRSLGLCVSQRMSTMTEEKKKSIEREMSDLSSTPTTTTMDIGETSGEQDVVQEMIDIFSDSIQTLRDEVQRLNEDCLCQSQSMETLGQNIALLKQSCEESNADLDGLNMNMIILQQECYSLREKVKESQSISYDGTLIWKITDIREKMIDAESERHVSIYSPSFYSSPTGYRMGARLYLFGDGNARRTHMSLFFVLKRTPHDSLLQFPFRYKVTFCLFDQTGQQRHIIDSFRPDTRSNSFQRPRSDMNIASGIPKFVPLSVIEQPNSPYIKDDTMFMKVMVDFEDLPKTILPYALCLNPGLPTHCQQQMIQEEIKRKTQLQPQVTSQLNPVNHEENVMSNSDLATIDLVVRTDSYK